MALKEIGTPALPQQDHIDHIQEHRVFLMSSWQQELTPQGRNVLEAHIREHLSFAYMVEQATRMQIEQELAQGGMYAESGGYPAGGNGGMAPQPGNEGVQGLAQGLETGNYGTV